MPREQRSASRLLNAAHAALVFVSDYRDELMRSYCLCDALGTPLRDTADPIESTHLREVEALIDRLASAINEELRT
jgi:hypothetical protein